MIFLQSLNKKDLIALLIPHSRDEKQARYRAKQIFNWVYQRHVLDWDGMTDLSKVLREWLKANIEIFRLEEQVNRQSLDGTHKFLWTLSDKRTIESVIIPAALSEENLEVNAELPNLEPDSEFAGRLEEGAVAQQGFSDTRFKRLTACISSQVGCAMACKFCLTGVQGFDRHLGAHEIVAQVLELRRRAPITNIVFMGMGEPLQNLENVIKACEILLDQDGLGFSKRKVTVSTSGIVPAIEELGRRTDVSLAVSLNGSTDEQRSQIMPVNKKWNIQALLDACRAYPLGPHRKITFEYVLMKDLNDSIEDALRIARLLRGIPCKVNLIPFNEHPGSEFKRSSDETVRAFQRALMDRGFVATVRISKGRDILAACGQLRSIFGTARGTDKHKDGVYRETIAPLNAKSPFLDARAKPVDGATRALSNGP